MHDPSLRSKATPFGAFHSHVPSEPASQTPSSQRTKALPLFRAEALAQQRERAWGEPVVAPPLWVRASAWGLLVLVACLVAWVMTTHYTRKARAPAVLAYVTAPAVVAAIEPGVLVDVLVTPGDRVDTGMLLARISTDRLVGGQGVSVAALADEAERLRALLAERDGVQALAQAQAHQARSRLEALEREIAQQRREIEAQQSRLDALQSQVERFRALARERFVSDMQHQQKADEAAEQRVRLESLRRILAGLEREQAALIAEIPAIDAGRRARLAAAEREIAVASSQRRRVAAQSSYELRAGSPGRVGRLIATPGQTVLAGEPVLTIERPEQELLADLYVASRNAGFVRAGQRVRLAIDAFPFERFGHVEATVTEVGTAIITPREAEAMRLPIAIAEPSFRLRARLSRTAITAYGREFPLHAGLTARADLLLDQRPLWTLPVDPILRLQGRL